MLLSPRRDNKIITWGVNEGFVWLYSGFEIFVELIVMITNNCTYGGLMLKT